jgi:hypothetical protein
VEKLIRLDEPVMETHEPSRDSLPSQVSPVSLSWRLADTLIVIVLVALSFFGALKAAEQINSRVLVSMNTDDAWFDGDIVQYYRMVSTLDGGYIRRTSKHPLFPLLAYPPVKAVRLLGIDRVTSVRVVIALVGAACIALLYYLLRLLGCRRFDATLFSLVSAVSASSMFWFVVPETYPFGSLSILLALTLVALGDFRSIAPVWYVIVSALTLSFTITNWLVGLLTTFVRFHLRKVVVISVAAFCLVLLLWGVQKVIFPGAEFLFLFPTAENREAEFVLLSERAGGPRKIVNTIVFHSMVMPAIEETEHPDPNKGALMSVQLSAPGSAGFLGKVAVGMWLALLVSGLWGFLVLGRQHRFRIVLTLTFFGGLAIHLFYGVETFLYTLHFIPLLVIIAALGTLTALRPVVLILAGALVVSAGINNASQFNRATEFVALHIGTEHQNVREAMERRPDDPWPRSAGHVVLAIPGSSDREKAYHEPGGSFSPGVDSFGISIWIMGKEGTLLATSDTISPSLMDQSFVWNGKDDLPSILTKSHYYQALWSSGGPKSWRLKFKSYSREGVRPMLMIRSVGPAGGPVTSLDWNGERLLINNRWIVTIAPRPSAVHLGEEGPEGWITSNSPVTRWSGENGWGYARLELTGGSDLDLIVEDTQIDNRSNNVTSVVAKSSVDLDLPDPRFAASLNAQVSHLMMGLVDRETRPADPTSYPLAWARPEAYIVTALARAGRVDTAKALSTHLAENDFFGGFGPEADSLGLAIWALEEVAARVDRRDYDRWLWPHVHRKADLILHMLSNDRPFQQTPIGPVIPKHRFDPMLSAVSQPSQNGLIVGKTEKTWSPLFVTAVSYRGLLNAALLADRLQQSADAARWRARAMDLKKAWAASFRKLESKEPFAYAIWPTGVWDSDPGVFFSGLRDQRERQYKSSGELRGSPPRTYTTVAETHPWLFAGREDLVWTTLDWFWNHQSSPGLYTWWEQSGSIDSVTPFRLWEQTRGWNKRPYVTPGYQTAAEMLLLQLDMLAYVDELASEPTIVIGSGVPAPWLDETMHVRRVSTSLGEVGWRWDGHEMRVTIRGCRCNVRLGPAFSADTPVRVAFKQH